MPETAPTIEAAVSQLQTQLASQQAQIQALTQALLSLGSQTLAGGPPGPAGYLKWHKAQSSAPVSPTATTGSVPPSSAGTTAASGSSPAA